MGGKEQNAGVVIKCPLGAISMVVIPVDDEDLF